MTIMTPSTEPITEGQIGKLSEVLAAKLRKHKNELPTNISQDVLGDPMLADKLFEVFRRLVEVRSKMIVRTLTVNRTRSAKEALTATGRVQYVTDSAVTEMPNGTAEEVEVLFFNLGRTVSNVELGKEYELRGLKPADPFTLAAVNEADPAFADEKTNGTQWKNAKGKYCFAAFGRWSVGKRVVLVHQDDDAWDGSWWFAGVRK